MIIVLHGKDQFRRQIKLNALKQEHLEPGMESLNFAQASNPALIDFVSIINTPGWGMSTKLIVVKDFEFLENKADDEDVERIIEALSNLPSTTVLVFDSEKVTGTIKLVKQIKSKLSNVEFCEYQAFSSWETKQAASWLRDAHREILKEFNSSIKAIDPQIAEHLVEQVGAEDSSKLYSELKRLTILNKEITLELINEECRARHDIFRFIKDLALGNIAKASLELDRIILSKEAHLGLLAILQTTVSRYLKFKLSERDRYNAEQQAALLGISSGRLYYTRQECGPMQIARLEALLEQSLDAERKIKTGKMPIERALRVLVNG